jgi:succinate-semialdehyde dehydrogenase/glutarate-semialdehyde dehydrogenase
VTLQKMLIKGEWVAAVSGRSFGVRNPATGEEIARAPAGSAEDAVSAVNAAQAAFRAWSQTPAAKRAVVLRRAGDQLMSRQEDISRLVTQEAGKPLRASRSEVRTAANFIYWYAEEGRRSYGEWIPDPLPDRRLLTIRQPLGVVAIILPWNYPAYMIGRTVAPALAAGCTVVIKPSKETPLTGLAVAQAFVDAGVPRGVVNVVTGDAHAIGQAFLDDLRVRKISFTGSVDIGKQLMRGAANHITRLTLELGGHAPFIILSDADLKKAIRGLISAKFGNAGQVCIAPNRIYIHSNLLETFLKRLSSEVKKLNVGNGLETDTDVGPLISNAAVEKVETHVNDAISKGARLILGGSRLTDGTYASGSFFAPTVLADVTSDMRITREETFGPVAAVMAFEAEDEVIQRANDSPYGLAAYLYTNNISKALRIAEQLEYGMVGVNDTRITAVESPFGGMKLSGIGREGGREGLAAFLETKLIALGI